MDTKVYPSQLSTLTSRELRELQKLHELGKKYWVSRNSRMVTSRILLPKKSPGSISVAGEKLINEDSLLATDSLVMHFNFLLDQY